MRVVLGVLVAFGALRFLVEGWVDALLATPDFFFSFYGLEWLPRPGDTAGTLLYATICAAGFAVALGWRFRMATVVLWLSFTYAELIDATNYLNHYYLVVLLLGILAVSPAHRLNSLDVRAGRVQASSTVPAWTVYLFLVQLAVVYFFAGLAKVNADWLLRAMPMAIWLPERSWWPIVGDVFTQQWVAYAASWFGCLYDLTIVLWLLWKPTRKWAYLAVLVFHGATSLLFNIGLFPAIMIGATLCFFDASWHQRLHAGIVQCFQVLRSAFAPMILLVPSRSITTLAYRASDHYSQEATTLPQHLDEQAVEQPSQAQSVSRWTRSLLVLFVAVQLALPLRAYAYPGQTAWTEEGYRFGWRVMLVEKFGTATFTLVDLRTGQRRAIRNEEFLTPYQEKQMAIQPDFMLQYAHHLGTLHRGTALWSDSLAVYVDSHVSLNARRSQRLVDPSVDLLQLQDGLSPKPWIIPFEQ